MSKIRTLIVDDSAFMRQFISKIIKSSSIAEVAGVARNGEEAIEKTMSLLPDVIILDVIMPKMDGITALKEIMKRRPTPTLILSSLSRKDVQSVLYAFESGAVDFLHKPGSTRADRQANLPTLQKEILTKIELAAGAQIQPLLEHKVEILRPKPSPAPVVERSFERIIVIGASTGGPRTVGGLLRQFPKTCPPILVIQHMPPEFTTRFAMSLNNSCEIRVQEANTGDRLEQGHAYVAKGGNHLVLDQVSSRSLMLTKDPPVNYRRPSIDSTLFSIAEIYKKKAMCIILTGMGSDGCEGARQVKRHGGTVIAEDESSAVIYGMPKAVIDAGLADYTSSAWKIPSIMRKLGWI